MKIRILKKSSNKMRWANKHIGDTFEVVLERDADDQQNITGGDEYAVRVGKDPATAYLGCIEKNLVEVIDASEITY